MGFQAKMDHEFAAGDLVGAKDHPRLGGRIVLFKRWPGWDEDVARVRPDDGGYDWWRAISNLERLDNA